MQKQVFKESQLYDWEAEPVDERPSEFMNSRSYAASSGYHSNFNTARRAPARSGSSGLAGVLLFALIVVAAGGWAIVKFAPMLHH